MHRPSDPFRWSPIGQGDGSRVTEGAIGSLIGLVSVSKSFWPAMCIVVMTSSSIGRQPLIKQETETSNDEPTRIKWPMERGQRSTERTLGAADRRRLATRRRLGRTTGGRRPAKDRRDTERSRKV